MGTKERETSVRAAQGTGTLPWCGKQRLRVQRWHLFGTVGWEDNQSQSLVGFRARQRWGLMGCVHMVALEAA